MDTEATRRAIGLITAQLDELATGSSLGTDLFGDVAGRAASDREAWEQTMALAVGLLNVSLILVSELSATTGRPPGELMQAIALQLE